MVAGFGKIGSGGVTAVATAQDGDIDGSDSREGKPATGGQACAKG
jgi:hypothetical protein